MVKCQKKIKKRTTRTFLGIYKYLVNLAINGDMGWTNYPDRQKFERTRLWNRIINMDDDQITKLTFNWEHDLGLNNWCNSVK